MAPQYHKYDEHGIVSMMSNLSFCFVPVQGVKSGGPTPLIHSEFEELPEIGSLRSRQRLGGFFQYHYREAA